MALLGIVVDCRGGLMLTTGTTGRLKTEFSTIGKVSPSPSANRPAFIFDAVEFSKGHHAAGRFSFGRSCAARPGRRGKYVKRAVRLAYQPQGINPDMLVEFEVDRRTQWRNLASLSL
jgi:hypothetical protein